MSIHDQLNMLGQAAERQLPSLNYGGCCVFAAEVGKALKAKGIPVRGIAAGHWWGDESPDLAKLHKQIGNVMDGNAWNSAGVNFSHVGLRVKLGCKWYNYDSAGLSPDLTRLRGRRWPTNPARIGRRPTRRPITWAS